MQWKMTGRNVFQREPTSVCLLDVPEILSSSDNRRRSGCAKNNGVGSFVIGEAGGEELLFTCVCYLL